MTRLTLGTAAALLLFVPLALTGCTTATPEIAITPSADATAGACAQVTVVVDFGVLDADPFEACSGAGAATDVLAEAGVTTEGTVDYGDQVLCRVNDEPAPDETVTIEGQTPFVESCLTLNPVAYWALWVKTSPEAEWGYAQEGVSTLQLAAGQSVGLVYTPGTESIPPKG